MEGEEWNHCRLGAEKNTNFVLVAFDLLISKKKPGYCWEKIKLDCSSPIAKVS